MYGELVRISKESVLDYFCVVIVHRLVSKRLSNGGVKKY
jgi:hypothetical protein